MKYNVCVCRIGYSYLTVEVEAENEEQAKEIAIDDADGSGGWDECSVEYEANIEDDCDE